MLSFSSIKMSIFKQFLQLFLVFVIVCLLLEFPSKMCQNLHFGIASSILFSFSYLVPSVIVLFHQNAPKFSFSNNFVDSLQFFLILFVLLLFSSMKKCQNFHLLTVSYLSSVFLLNWLLFKFPSKSPFWDSFFDSLSLSYAYCYYSPPKRFLKIFIFGLFLSLFGFSSSS